MTLPHPIPKSITPAEVAAEWGVSERRVRRLARQLGACRIIGKTMFFLPQDVERLTALTTPENKKLLAELACEIRRERMADPPPPPKDNRGHVYFIEKRHTLHLFSGKVDLTVFPGDTVDVNPDLRPTYVDDAQTLENVPLEKYDLVLADPPYSVEDCERYGTSMVKRNRVMRALQRLRSGAHVVWLDQVLPMYRKDAFAQEAVIGMWKSTNHRFRGITIFRRI